MKNIILSLLLVCCTVVGIACKSPEATPGAPSAAPVPPAGPYAIEVSSISETAAVLKWIMPQPGADDPDPTLWCMIERSADSVSYTVVDSVKIDITMKAVAGLYRPDTTYTFRLRARSAHHYSYYSNTVAGKLTFPAPSSVSVASMNEMSASLQWYYLNAFQTGFLIERSADGAAYVLVDSAQSGATTKDIAGTYLPGVAYSFRVRAKSLYNMSPYSAPVSRTMTAMVMVPVAGGTFQMGSAAGETDELPMHSVSVGSFRIDRYEITNEKWNSVVLWGKTHGYTDLETRPLGNSTIGVNTPATYVTWYDAVKWCNARSEKEGAAPVYYTDNTLTTVYRVGRLDLASDAVKWSASGYRLPTEAEWEFAARGGLGSLGTSYSGGSAAGGVGWYYDNSNNSVHAVGLKAANELGLYDMSGNAGEWCNDWYGQYQSALQIDPKGAASGANRVWRGGSYSMGEQVCRVANRISRNPFSTDFTLGSLGFRCVSH